MRKVNLTELLNATDRVEKRLDETFEKHKQTDY